MKRLIALLLVFLLLGSLCACGNAPAETSQGKLSIVTTIFPEYDWVREILGDRLEDVELTMLLDSGVDLHNYQPTADDIIKISTCDMFIYVGGESDSWVADTLKEATNGNMVVISLLDVLGDAVKQEEIVEGMEHDEDEEEGEADEHVWLSLKNAEIICSYLAEAIAAMDGDSAVVYEENAAAYIEKLRALDGRYEAAVVEASGDTLLFGDRFPLRYLAEDYGLTYYAAFSGCSAETEASFETVAFLAGKVDELELSCVMTIEGSDHRLAETIVSTTAEKNQTVLTVDSMQSVTAADVKNGAGYLAIMEKNLTVLAEALG